MTHLFYFMGLLFLIYEVYFLLNIKEEINKSKMYEEFSKENPDTKYSELPDKIQKILLGKILIGLPYVLWMFVGILSSQWVMFGSYLIFTFSIITPFRKFVGYSPARFYFTFTDTVICIFVIGFIIINKYHLHIDTFTYIKNLFNI